MTNWRYWFFRTLTRLVQFAQRLMPNTYTPLWTAARQLSRYVGWPAVLPPICIESERRRGVACEWLIPETITGDGVVMAIHGGGNVFNWHGMHRHTYGWIAHWSQCRVIGPDFRIGAEHPYPAGLDDCITVYESLLDEGVAPDSIVILGDSSGGNIATALLLRLRDEGYPLPAAAALIAPVLDVTFKEDNPDKVDDPFTNLPFIKAQFQHYCRDIADDNPMCSPVFAELHGLPPLRIDVGEDEVLRNDAEWFTERARAVGVPVELVIWPELWHGWYLYAPYLPEARAVHQAIAEYIQEWV